MTNDLLNFVIQQNKKEVIMYKRIYQDKEEKIQNTRLSLYSPL